MGRGHRFRILQFYRPTGGGHAPFAGRVLRGRHCLAGAGRRPARRRGWRSGLDRRSPGSGAAAPNAGGGDFRRRRCARRRVPGPGLRPGAPRKGRLRPDRGVGCRWGGPGGGPERVVPSDSGSAGRGERHPARRGCGTLLGFPAEPPGALRGEPAGGGVSGVRERSRGTRRPPPGDRALPGARGLGAAGGGVALRRGVPHGAGRRRPRHSGRSAGGRSFAGSGERHDLEPVPARADREPHDRSAGGVRRGAGGGAGRAPRCGAGGVSGGVTPAGGAARARTGVRVPGAAPLVAPLAAGRRDGVDRGGGVGAF